MGAKSDQNNLRKAVKHGFYISCHIKCGQSRPRTIVDPDHSNLQPLVLNQVFYLPSATIGDGVNSFPRRTLGAMHPDAPRKAVDLDHFSLWRATYFKLDMLVLEWKFSSWGIWIQGSPAIAGTGRKRVELYFQHTSGMEVFWVGKGSKEWKRVCTITN